MMKLRRESRSQKSEYGRKLPAPDFRLLNSFENQEVLVTWT